MPVLNQQQVLKEGEIFLLSDENGDIQGDLPGSTQGLFYQDTRYLSGLSLRLNSQAPPLLTVSGYRNFMATFQYANDALRLQDGRVAGPRSISVRRSRLISSGLHERLGLLNYNRFPAPITVTLMFGADFRDIFDIRGYYSNADMRGEAARPVYSGGKLRLQYQGRDSIHRRTVIAFDDPPDSVDLLEPGTAITEDPDQEQPIGWRAIATWHLTLEPNTATALAYHIVPESGDAATALEWLEQAEQAEVAAVALAPTLIEPGLFDLAVDQVLISYTDWNKQSTRFTTDNDEFNALLDRCNYDLRLLSQPEEDGYFPSAGIPLFCCPFGRDSLITALQTLALNPRIAVGTLKMLARHQGTQEDPWRDEQPGKILHEMRFGELSHLGVVPHTPYYGTADATPMFVMLFVETMRWLDDGTLFHDLMPNIKRALEWIDRWGDVDGDGFVEYTASPSPVGLRNQVWKDNPDSTQFPDGTLAETPIAAVEVQGYVYAAKRGLAELLRRKGDTETAIRLEAEATALKDRFNQAFWMPAESYYAQALDRGKRPVPTISSNPGHCLWTGIADEHLAMSVVERMMKPDMLTGWGIRTISDTSPSFNPMSYHNGSVWPHDNSIIVAGMKRYGYSHDANQVISEITEAAQHFSYLRLPELYCGFTRDRLYSSGPAEYPVSCSPQAWAAGAPVLMLQTMLGLDADSYDNRVRLAPDLPDWLTRIEINGLRIGKTHVDLVVERRGTRHDARFTSKSEGISLLLEA